MQAEINQREEEKMGRKEDRSMKGSIGIYSYVSNFGRALQHAEQLRKDRETILSIITGYHRHIDGCMAEMSK